MVITKAAVVCHVHITIEVYDSDRYHDFAITTAFLFHSKGSGSSSGKLSRMHRSAKGCRSKRKLIKPKLFW
jgi:hypothetical protein